MKENVEQRKLSSENNLLLHFCYDILTYKGTTDV